MAGPLDTTAIADQIHVEAYRELGIGGRLKIALELSDLTHAFAIAGIKRRHPECVNDQDARAMLAELLYVTESAR